MGVSRRELMQKGAKFALGIGLGAPLLGSEGPFAWLKSPGQPATDMSFHPSYYGALRLRLIRSKATLLIVKIGCSSTFRTACSKNIDRCFPIFDLLALISGEKSVPRPEYYADSAVVAFRRPNNDVPMPELQTD